MNPTIINLKSNDDDDDDNDDGDDDDDDDDDDDMLQLDELNYNADYNDHVGYHWMCGHFTEKPVDTCLAVQPQSVDVVSMIIGINIGVSVSIVDIVINYSSRSSSSAILRDSN